MSKSELTTDLASILERSCQSNSEAAAELSSLIEKANRANEEVESETSATSNGNGDVSASENRTHRSIHEQLGELQDSVRFLSHQVVMIMKALHVESCRCDSCRNGLPAIHLHLNNGQMPLLTPEASFNIQSIILKRGSMNTEELTALLPGSDYAQRAGGGKLSGAERRAISEYATTHGGIAAARKFGVPPPVASYYQRKSTGESPGPSNEAPALVISTTSGASQACKEDDTKELSGAGVESMLKMNSAHNSGSPGFLRGRGRGRPKLIGDELDADLVEYMVRVKQTDLHGHLSASQALSIAREYIMERAPGLLDEHGGHVRLKLTWAMKLVSRVAERQREMELGLPPGTLQSFGKHTPFGNSVQLCPSGEGSEEGAAVILGATPQILNIKELNLDFPIDRSGAPTAGEIPSNVGPNGEILFQADDDDIQIVQRT